MLEKKLYRLTNEFLLKNIRTRKHKGSCKKWQGSSCIKHSCIHLSLLSIGLSNLVKLLIDSALTIWLLSLFRSSTALSEIQFLRISSRIKLYQGLTRHFRSMLITNSWILSISHLLCILRHLKSLSDSLSFWLWKITREFRQGITIADTVKESVL